MTKDINEIIDEIVNDDAFWEECMRLAEERMKKIKEALND